jgi:hypothetical protein
MAGVSVVQTNRGRLATAVLILHFAFTLARSSRVNDSTTVFSGEWYNISALLLACGLKLFLAAA